MKREYYLASANLVRAEGRPLGQAKHNQGLVFRSSKADLKIFFKT